MTMNKQDYQPPRFLDAERLFKVQQLQSEVDAIYKEFAEANHIPGYAYGVMLDGELVYQGSGGYIDLEKKIPATTQSMFRIASMTKSFTALALLMLRDAGQLRLDDLVENYIPEMKNQQLTKDAAAITIRDLLTHAAGFPSDDPWGDRQLDSSDDELIAILQQGVFFSNTSGVSYEYSNLGYALLGHIIQKVSGLSYADFTKQKICQPLNMNDVSMDFQNISPSQLAHGYRWEEERWKEESLLPDGAFGSMGGMITSIESFSKYIALHMTAWPPRDEKESGPLKRSSLREMHLPWRFSDLVVDFDDKTAQTMAYGYGLSWQQDLKKKVFVGHSGGLPGFGSNWSFMPEYGLGVICLANATYAPAHKVNRKVLDQICDTARLKPRQLPVSNVLLERQKDLIKLLPHWEKGETSGIFAENFFLDFPIHLLRKEARELFEKAGPLLSIGDVEAESQLRGQFIVEGEVSNLLIHLALSPQNPPLIQSYQIKEVDKLIRNIIL